MPNSKAGRFAVNNRLTLTSSDSSILPEDLATQSVRLKEEQLRREEEKVRDSYQPAHQSELTVPSAPRDRVESPTRNQRKTTRAPRQRGISQVSKF